MSAVLIQTCRETKGGRAQSQLHPVTLTPSMESAAGKTQTPHAVRGFPRWPRGGSGSSYLFPEFSSDVAKPLGSIEAHGLQTPVPQHFQHLSVLWKNRGGGVIYLDPLLWKMNMKPWLLQQRFRSVQKPMLGLWVEGSHRGHTGVNLGGLREREGCWTDSTSGSNLMISLSPCFSMVIVLERCLFLFPLTCSVAG